MRTPLSALTYAIVAAAASVAVSGFGAFDFGLFRDDQASSHSEQLFGIVSPVEASSPESVGATDAKADPTGRSHKHSPTQRSPRSSFFVLGSADFAMMDNIAFEPIHGNYVINEDGDGPEVGRNNDIWSCLPDGDDADDQSDGCVRVATLNDLTAETTGGLFDKSGTRYYVSVQHNVTGHSVVLDITGW